MKCLMLGLGLLVLIWHAKVSAADDTCSLRIRAALERAHIMLDGRIPLIQPYMQVPKECWSPKYNDECYMRAFHEAQVKMAKDIAVLLDECP